MTQRITKQRLGRPMALLALLLAALACVGLTSQAQEAPAGPMRPKPGVEPQKPTKKVEEDQVIRSRVNEVTAPVAVRDAQGEIVLNLSKKNFHVFDNGAEQSIDHFDLGGDALSVVLAVETSSHIEPMLPAVRKTGIIFTQTVMAKSAEAAVIGYDDEVNLLHGFTSEPDEVQAIVNGLPEGSSGSLLYDAMARGVSLLSEEPVSRRRVLLIVGEPRDTGSVNTLGEVLRQAQLSNVTIYSVGLSSTLADLRAKPSQYEPPQVSPPGTYGVPTPNGQLQTPQLEQQVQGNMDIGALAVWLVRTGKNLLTPNSLAVASNATGGFHANVLKDATVEKAMDSIGGELHAEYTISYHPPGDEPSGYHEIKITVDKPGLTVRTRPGYYIPPPPA
jgi:VWFA-related protein